MSIGHGLESERYAVWIIRHFNLLPCARLRAHFFPAIVVQENAVAQSEQVEPEEAVSTPQVKFDTLNLDASVQKGIDALGFEFCSRRSLVGESGFTSKPISKESESATYEAIYGTQIWML